MPPRGDLELRHRPCGAHLCNEPDRIGIGRARNCRGRPPGSHPGGLFALQPGRCTTCNPWLCLLTLYTLVWHRQRTGRSARAAEPQPGAAAPPGAVRDGSRAPPAPAPAPLRPRAPVGARGRLRTAPPAGAAPSPANGRPAAARCCPCGAWSCMPGCHAPRRVVRLLLLADPAPAVGGCGRCLPALARAAAPRAHSLLRTPPLMLLTAMRSAMADLHLSRSAL